MKQLTYLLLLALTGCNFVDRIALPDHRYKGTAVLHVIEKGAKHSNERSPSPVNGDGVKFNFNFQEVATQNDSSIHKIYGLSDAWSQHHKYSARMGFRVRQDSTIDVFAYFYNDGHFGYKWMGNVSRYEWHPGGVEIEKDFYEFRLDEKVLRVPRSKHMLWGIKYRLFPFYEDNENKGAPGRIAVMIEEI